MFVIVSDCLSPVSRPPEIYHKMNHNQMQRDDEMDRALPADGVDLGVNANNDEDARRKGCC